MGDQIKEDKMSVECGMNGGEKKCLQFVRPWCRWDDNIRIGTK
jgi:hypothetical protein